MSNIFNDDDESQDFRDIPDEVVEGNSAPIPNVRLNRPAPQAPVQQPRQQVQAQPEPVYEGPVDNELEESDEEDFSTILNDARQRMEQGRLYEILMDHDLFSGQGFDEKAVKFVTKQIRNFAKEQMEIMLGMRQETPKNEVTITNFPFNDVEITFLKDLAFMGTKGQSGAPEAQQFSGAQTPAVPRKAGINAITAKPAVKPIAKPAAQKPAPKPLAKTAPAPVQRQQPQRNEEEILDLCAELGISREEYDRQYSSFSSALTKPMSQMSEAEVAERNRQIALRSGKKAINPSAIPMPSAEQEEILHTQRAQTAAANPQMQVLMAALTKKK